MLESMTRPHVVALGGTLRRPSTSLLALERALQAAEAEGATTDLIPLHTLDLPMFEPGRALDAYPERVVDLLDRVAAADALLLSSAGYHGTVVGATKNALDFFEFLRNRERPYLDERLVGLIATAGGDQAAIRTIDTLIHVVHALRGTVLPLQVPIPRAKKIFADGQIRDDGVAERLDNLGRLLVRRTCERTDARAVA